MIALSPLECGRHLELIAVAILGGQESRWTGCSVSLRDPCAAIEAIVAADNPPYPPPQARGWPWLHVGRGDPARGYARAIDAIMSAPDRARAELRAVVTGAPARLMTWIDAAPGTQTWGLGMTHPSAAERPISAWSAVLLGRLAAAFPSPWDIGAALGARDWWGDDDIAHGREQNGMLMLPTWRDWRSPADVADLLRGDASAWVAEDVSALAYARRQSIRGPLPSYCGVAMTARERRPKPSAKCASMRPAPHTPNIRVGHGNAIND